jgi:ketosteroid isomerase-like protein
VTNSEAVRFAEEWIDNFNRKDAEPVLRHFAEDATFRSPRALAFGGRTTLHSREELATYWNAALRSIGSLHFTLDRVVNDPAAGLLVILYVAEIDGGRVRAAEVYRFNEFSRIVQGEAMYGAALSEI